MIDRPLLEALDPTTHVGNCLTAVSQLASLLRRDALRDLRAKLLAMRGE